MNVSETPVFDWLSGCSIPPLPFVDGENRMSADPCIIPSRRMKSINAAALAVCAAYDELCGILARDPSHLEDFFGLTPLEKMLWYASGGLWHGIARADVFCTAGGGVAVAEVNSDTPSGADEAYELGAYAAGRFPGLINPCARLPEAFLSVIRRAYACLGLKSSARTAGIVYPTDIPEDQGMIELYREWLEGDGWRVVTGSPANLGQGENGRACLFGTEIDLLLRHYKTDWWCERSNVWRDARGIPDSGALTRELRAVVEPMAGGKLAVVNPFGAVITQNKLSLAFFHEKPDLFPAGTREAIRKYIPLTLRLSSLETETLEREKDDWVLKSDYGCEGAEVIVGRLTSMESWKHALSLALPSRWVAQRFFEAERQDGGAIENYGVYVAGGEPAGVYVRISHGITGSRSVVAPALERPPLEGRASAAPLSVCSVSPAHTRVRDIVDAYNPGARWRGFSRALLLHSAAREQLITHFIPGELTDAAARAGAALADLIEAADETLRRSILIVSDLDGPSSVAFASGLARAADVVIQIENMAHEREVVPLRETLGALVHYGPAIRECHVASAEEEGRPGVIVLERRRMDSVNDDLTQFNNRHWAYLPSVGALERMGIDTVLYVHAESEERERDDLNEDFALYLESGRQISFCAMTSLLQAKSGGLEILLRENARSPVRRETPFTYLLAPPGEEGRFTFDQEETEE